jgi:hypothetical protein
MWHPPLPLGRPIPVNNPTNQRPTGYRTEVTAVGAGRLVVTDHSHRARPAIDRRDSFDQESRRVSRIRHRHHITSMHPPEPHDHQSVARDQGRQHAGAMDGDPTDTDCSRRDSGEKGHSEHPNH